MIIRLMHSYEFLFSLCFHYSDNQTTKTRIEKQRTSLSEFIWMVKSLDSKTVIRFGLKTKISNLKTILATEGQRDLKTRALARVCGKSCMLSAIKQFRAEYKKSMQSKSRYH